MTRAAQIEGDHGMPFGKLRHDLSPLPPSLWPAMEENERWSIAAYDSMDICIARAQQLVTEVVQLIAHRGSFR